MKLQFQSFLLGFFIPHFAQNYHKLNQKIGNDQEITGDEKIPRETKVIGIIVDLREIVVIKEGEVIISRDEFTGPFDQRKGKEFHWLNRD